MAKRFVGFVPRIPGVADLRLADKGRGPGVAQNITAEVPLAPDHATSSCMEIVLVHDVGCCMGLVFLCVRESEIGVSDIK